MGLVSNANGHCFVSVLTNHSASLNVILWSIKGCGLHYGGAGMTAYRLFSSADPGVFRLTQVHGNPDQQQYPLFHQQVFLYPGVYKGVTRNPWFRIRFIHRGKRWLREHFRDQDVFYGLSGYQYTFAPALCARRLGLVSVIKLATHRAELADKQGGIRLTGMSRWRRKRLHELSGVVAISSEIRQELLEYGLDDRRIAVIPNGVDTNHFHPINSVAEKKSLRSKLGWTDAPTVLFAGGINQRKRPDLLIEAIAQVRMAGHSCRLVLAGPVFANQADYHHRLKDQAAQLGVESSVEWHGMSDQMADLYRASDIFALPSSNEGMSNAVLEAMASGIPSIVTKVSGMSDLIQDNCTGRHVDPDPAVIADALIQYLESPSMMHQHGLASRARAMELFSSKRIAWAHQQLFHCLLKGGNAADCSLIESR